nr:MAG TPA: hypothetical protein [Caudoviricetes sp.]
MKISEIQPSPRLKNTNLKLQSIVLSIRSI